MAVSLKDIENAPTFNKLSEANKEKVRFDFTQENWNAIKGNHEYYLADAVKKAEVKEAFDKEHAMGPAVRVEEENQDNSYLENMAKLAFGGAEGTLSSVRTADNAVTGNSDSGLADELLNQINKEDTAYTPYEMKQVEQVMAAQQKKWQAAQGFVQKSSVAFGSMFEVAKQAITNFEGTSYLAASSFANMVPGVVGGAIGQAAIPIPVVGAAIGQFVGGVATESGAYLREKVREGLIEKNLPKTKEGIQVLLDDAEFMEQASDKSLAKGIGTAGIDVLTGIGIGKAFNSTNIAKGVALKKLERAGVEATEEAIQAEASLALKNMSVLQKAANKANGYMAEIGSEVTSEAAGQLAAEGEVDMGELMGEALGAIGNGPIMYSADKALYGAKSIADSSTEENASKLKAIAKGVTSTLDAIPKAAKATIDAVKGTKTEGEETPLINTPTKADYKKNLKAAVETNNVTDISDPASKKYDPIMTATALHTLNQKPNATLEDKINNQDKIMDLSRGLTENSVKFYKEAQEIDKQLSENTATMDDAAKTAAKAKYDSLMKKAEDLLSVRTEIAPIIQAMSAPNASVTEKEKQASLTKIHTVLKGNDSQAVKDTVLSIFGSKNHEAIDDGVLLQEALNNPNFDAGTKETLQHTQAFITAKKDLISSIAARDNKSTEEVNSEVLTGSKENRGITDYLSAISRLTQEGKNNTAKTQLNKLERFADRHTAKAELFKRAYDLQGKLTDPQDIADMAKLNEKRDVKNQKPYSFTPAAKGFIETMGKEADALNKAVLAAKSVVGIASAPVSNSGTVLDVKDDAIRKLGFSDDMIKKFSDPVKEVLLAHKDSSLDDIVISGKKYGEYDQEKPALRQLYSIKKAQLEPVKADPPKVDPPKNKVEITPEEDAVKTDALVKDYFTQGHAEFKKKHDTESNESNKILMSKVLNASDWLSKQVSNSAYKKDENGNMLKESYEKLKNETDIQLKASNLTDAEIGHLTTVTKLLDAKIAAIPDSSKTGIKTPVKDYYNQSIDSMKSLLKQETDPEKKDTLTRAYKAIGYVKISTMGKSTLDAFTKVRDETVTKMGQKGLTEKSLSMYQDALDMLDSHITDVTPVKPKPSVKDYYAHAPGTINTLIGKETDSYTKDILNRAKTAINSISNIIDTGRLRVNGVVSRESYAGIQKQFEERSKTITDPKEKEYNNDAIELLSAKIADIDSKPVLSEDDTLISHGFTKAEVKKMAIKNKAGILQILAGRVDNAPLSESVPVAIRKAITKLDSRNAKAKNAKNTVIKDIQKKRNKTDKLQGNKKITALIEHGYTEDEINDTEALWHEDQTELLFALNTTPEERQAWAKDHTDNTEEYNTEIAEYDRVIKEHEDRIKQPVVTRKFNTKSVKPGKHADPVTIEKELNKVEYPEALSTMGGACFAVSKHIQAELKKAGIEHTDLLHVSVNQATHDGKTAPGDHRVTLFNIRERVYIADIPQSYMVYNTKTGDISLKAGITTADTKVRIYPFERATEFYDFLMPEASRLTRDDDPHELYKLINNNLDYMLQFEESLKAEVKQHTGSKLAIPQKKLERAKRSLALIENLKQGKPNKTNTVLNTNTVFDNIFKSSIAEANKELSEMGFTEKDIKALETQVDIYSKNLHRLTNQVSEEDAVAWVMSHSDTETNNKRIADSLRKLYKINKEKANAKTEKVDGTEEGSSETTDSGLDKGKRRTREKSSTNESDKKKDGSVSKADKPLYINEVLTTPDDSDPTNKVKHAFRAKAPKKGEKTLLLQEYTDILTIMNAEDIAKTGLFTEQELENEKVVAVIDTIRNFGTKFVEHCNKEFKKPEQIKPGKNDYRHKDAIQYLVDKEGNLPPEVVNALMVAAYKWLVVSTDKNIYNNDSAVRKILSVGKDQSLDSLTRELVSTIGTNSNYVIPVMGKMVYKLLEIEVIPEFADREIESRLIQSLGLQAIATLKSLQLLEEIYVMNGAKNDKAKNIKTGLFGLANYTKASLVLKAEYDVDALRNTFIKPAGSPSKPGESVSIFYRVTTKPDEMTGDTVLKSDKLSNMITVYKKARDAWDTLFSHERYRESYSWKPFKHKKGKVRGVNNSQFKATQEQTDILDNHENKPIIASLPTMGMYEILGWENIKQILGWKDPKSVHAYHRIGVVGKNRDILADHEAVLAWQEDAAFQSDGLNTPFHASQDIWLQGRMGQVGPVNMQGTKNHRALYSLKDWEYTVDLKDETIEKAFLESVAFHLDIETLKVGGLDNALEKLNNTIYSKKDTVVLDAVKGLQTILENNNDFIDMYYGEIDNLGLRDLYSKEIAAITKAVISIDKGMLGLKGLTEYARYLNAKEAKKPSFETNLPTEIDGVGNGMFLSRMQMIGETADGLMTIAALQNGGLSFTKEDTGLASFASKPFNLDAYKSVGWHWSNFLTRVHARAHIGEQSEPAKIAYERFKAIERLFGLLRENDGSLSKFLRKISKEPTMKTIFGMMDTTLRKELFETFIDNTYTKVAELTAAKDWHSLNQFNEDIRIALGTGIPFQPLNNNTHLTNEAMGSLGRLLDEHHGKGLSHAIETVYGSMQQVFKTTNYAINLSTAMYNTMYKLLIEDAEKALYDSLITPGMDIHQKNYIKKTKHISVAKVKEIEKSIEGMFPQLTTPTGGIIALAEISKEKSYVEDNDNTNAITQKYNNLPNAKAIPYTMGGADIPGVRATSLSIHNIDSVIALNAMKLFSILNNHDGFTINASQAKEVGTAINKTCFKTLQDTDLISNILDATSNIRKAFNAKKSELINDSGVYEQHIENYLLREMHNANLYDFYSKEKGPEGLPIKYPVKKDTLRDVINLIMHELGQTAETTTRNKKAVLDAAYALEQYSYPDGHYATGNNTDTVSINGEAFSLPQVTSAIKDTFENEESYIQSIYSILREDKKNSLTPQVKEDFTGESFDTPTGSLDLYDSSVFDYSDYGDINIDNLSENPIPENNKDAGVTESELIPVESEPVAEVKPEPKKKRGRPKKEKPADIKGSKPDVNETMSIDPNDYSIRQAINRMNVVDVYNNIKADSTVVDDAEHDQHLQRILNDVVRNVMDPIDVYMKNNPNREPEGVFVDEGSGKGRIFITNQNHITGPISLALHQGIRMSTGEVYTHELIHPILKLGLDKLSGLRNRVDMLFRMAKKDLEKNAEGFRVFLNDPDINLTDPAYTYEIKAAEARYDYIFNNASTTKYSLFDNNTDPATGIKRERERSNYLDEFATHGLTNKNFLKYLRTQKVTNTEYTKSTWAGMKGKNIQEMLGNIFDQVMQFFFNKFTKHHVAETMDKELERLVILLAQRNSNQKSRIYATVKVAEAKYSKTTEQGNAFVKKYANKLTVTKAAQAVRRVIMDSKDKDNSFGQHIRNVIYAYQRLDQGIIKSLLTEMAGRTERMDWLHTLLTKKHLMLDGAKETEINKVITMFNSLFKDKLLPVQKVAITKIGLKADLSVVFDSLGSDGLIKALGSDKEIDTQIKAINNAMLSDSELAPWVAYYNKACDAMGHFMVHGRGRSQEEVFQNTRVIAALRNNPGEGKLSNEAVDKAEAFVDQLGSLYALQYTASDQRNTFLELMKEQPDALKGVFQLHKVLKDTAKEASFKVSPFKFIKGYTKEILNPRIGMQVSTLENEAELARAGYTRQPVPVDRDPDDMFKDKPFYVYTSRTGRVHDLASMILSYKSNHAKGTKGADLAKTLGFTADIQGISGGYIAAEGIEMNNRVRAARKAVIANMINPNYKPRLNKGNFLIPQVDDNGKILYYRYMMAETTKDNHLEKMNDADIILGSMAGQIIDKALTPVINNELMSGLRVMYNDEYIDNPKSFLEISPDSEDLKLREIYYMIPASTRNFAYKIWGGNKIFVAKDVMDIVFGYRQYSIVEAFTKKPEERAKLEKLVVGVGTLLFKDKAVHRMNSLESILMEATSFAKSNIIVKSLYITLGNFGSNLTHLKSKGVPVSQIIKVGWEAMVMGNKYQADTKELGQLELKRDMLKKGGATSTKALDAQISRLKDIIYRNPTTLTIEAGLMPTLVDDIDTLTTGRSFPSKIEKKATELTEKLPPLIRNVGKTLVLAEDTKMFKTLNNAVKMTDFVGRHVLYTYLTEQGMPHSEAIKAAVDQFVNFDIPTHKMVDYGNAIGFLWFTKYAARILKVVKNTATDKPVTVALSLMTSHTLGLDSIFGSIPGITKDLFSNVSNPASALVDSIGENVFIDALKSIF